MFAKINKETGAVIEAPISATRAMLDMSDEEKSKKGIVDCVLVNYDYDMRKEVRIDTATCIFDGVKVIATYSVVPKSKVVIRQDAINRLNNLFDNTVKDVKVTTGFGEFSVSDSVLRYFEILLRKAKRDNALVVSIKDSSGNILEVTPEALENIIHAIEDYVIILVEKKFTKEYEIASSETPWEIDIKNTFR